MKLRTAAARSTPSSVTRRRFLQTCPAAAAAPWLAVGDANAAASPLPAAAAGHPRPTAGRAARVIQLHMAGNLRSGLPAHGQPFETIHFIHALRNDPQHPAPAAWLPQASVPTAGSPSFGAWVSYGLSMQHDPQTLPPHLVLGRRGDPFCAAGSALCASGFLPSHCQGIHCSGQGDPVLFLADPVGVGTTARSEMIHAISQIKHRAYLRLRGPAGAAPIAQGEMAYRMQKTASEAADIGRESVRTLRLYGAQPGRESFANRCLLARRLIERGARYVQLFADRPGAPVAALLTDLRRRGLLDQTLVIGSSADAPRWNHRARSSGNPRPSGSGQTQAFSVWLAGGGATGGDSHRRFEPQESTAIDRPVRPVDLQATILHWLGIDPGQLAARASDDAAPRGWQQARPLHELFA